MAGVKTNSDEDEDWYPGKILGLGKADGDWFPGKMLGRKRNKDIDDRELSCSEFPLIWDSIEQLVGALAMIDKVDEVLAALEICVTIIDDNLILTAATLNALNRVAKGHVEKMVQLGEGGACESVVKLLQFNIHCCNVAAATVKRAQVHPYHDSVQACLVAAVTAIEGLSAGCKKNRHRLARAGACFYLVEGLRRHCRDGENISLLEASLNTVWQLSFSNKLSKKCFRDCGCENELWLISENSHYPHPVRHRALSVLRWLKAQLVDDVCEIFDPRTLAGALLVSVSDISMTTVQGNAADAVKIANGCFLALENLLICGDSSTVMQDAIENVYLPATLIIVARRILRFYKKIFHENEEGLYEFIGRVSTTVCCFLSKEYRQERKVARTDLDGDTVLLLDKIAELLPSPAVKRGASDDVQTYSYFERSDAIILASPLEKRILSLEYDLIATSGRQMRRAGACKLFVRALALFVQEEKTVSVTSLKKKPRTPAPTSSDPLSFFSLAADTFTKGLLSGLHEVQAGLTLFGDKQEESWGSPSSTPFPDGPDGICVDSLCDCIRILSEASPVTRLHLFEEKICGIGNSLLSSAYASRIEDLYCFMLTRITEDFLCAKLSLKNVDAISDVQAVVVILALKSLSQGGCTLLVTLSQKVHLAAVALMSAALDAISAIVSRFGIVGDQLLREMSGYEILFAAATSKFLSNHRLAESWLKMCTDIALARIESKEILGCYGACDICMTVLRVHSLRPNIVQCSLWAICVLIGNHPANVERLLSCSHDNWTEASVKKYLQGIKQNKGQTEEARGHASLICCSIDMFGKSKRTPSSPTAPAAASRVIKLGSSMARSLTEKGQGTISSGASGSLARVELLSTDEEATEYMHILRSSNCPVSDCIAYDLSIFPNLNSEPFFRFNIVADSKKYFIGSEKSIPGVIEV